MIAAPVAWALEVETGSAQQAIVSMPSADVTPPGYGFFMHESQVGRNHQGALAWDTTHFLTYGVGGHTELALTHFGAFAPDPGAKQTLAFGFKSAVPVLPEDGTHAVELRVVVGAMGLASFVDPSLGGWLYGLVAARWAATGTRLGLGASLGTAQLFGDRDPGSWLLSLEQPIPWVPGLTFVAEWFSGSHDLANLIAGLAFHPDKTWIFVVGWKMPTDDRDIHLDEQGWVAEVGVFWH